MGSEALRALSQHLDELKRATLSGNLFKKAPIIPFVPTLQLCRYCDNELLLRRTETRTIYTLAIGIFEAHIRQKYCKFCGAVYSCEALSQMVPSHCCVGFDVLDYVGRALFIECLNEAEIQRRLQAKNMRTYIIRRLLLVVPTIFLLTIIVFIVVRMIPGDVIDAMMSEMSQLGTTVDRELIRHKLGLDVPVYVQYARWIGGVLQGDLGVSLRGEQAITPKILARLPVTFELGVFAVLIGLLISLPIGIYSAIRQNTISDYAGRGIAVTFISVPTFWTATMVMLYPAI